MSKCHWPVKTGFRLSRLLLVSLFTLFIVAAPLQGIASDRASVQARWASAISNDNADVLQTILDDHTQRQPDTAEPVWEITASNGKTALMVASKAGNRTLARQLVERGADIEAHTQTGGTAFMFAVLGDQQPLAAWLLAQGAQIDARGSNGWTSIMIASAKGLNSTLSWLLQQGANANTPDVYGFSPLMRAVDNGYATTVQLLIDDGNANVLWQDELDNSALHYAVSATDTIIVKQLLAAGAVARVKNRNGQTPLDLARQALDTPTPGQTPMQRRMALVNLLEDSIGTRD